MTKLPAISCLAKSASFLSASSTRARFPRRDSFVPAIRVTVSPSLTLAKRERPPSFVTASGWINSKLPSILRPKGKRVVKARTFPPCPDCKTDEIAPPLHLLDACGEERSDGRVRTMSE